MRSASLVPTVLNSFKNLLEVLFQPDWSPKLKKIVNKQTQKSSIIMFKMISVKIVPFIFLISCYRALPIDDDTVEIIANEIDDNSIDGEETIDLSMLGPEAFGMPTNESGKSTFYFVSTFSVFATKFSICTSLA